MLATNRLLGANKLSGFVARLRRRARDTFWEREACPRLEAPTFGGVHPSPNMVALDDNYADTGGRDPIAPENGASTNACTTAVHARAKLLRL